MEFKEIWTLINSKSFNEILVETIALTFGSLGFLLVILTFGMNELSSTTGQNFLIMALGCFGAYGFLITLFFSDEEQKRDKILRHVKIFLLIALISILWSPLSVFLGHQDDILLQSMEFVSSVFFQVFVIFFLILLIASIIFPNVQISDRKKSE